MCKTRKGGFSLVELSIVLVILGLLVGGILAGQSLIRAAELRTVGTQLSQFTTAVHSFRDKYFALPADMTNAASVWPSATNGNGNGQIDIGSTGVAGEMFGFWQQLALAGLIEGSYSGAAGPGSGMDTIPGTNAPRGRMGTGSAWSIFYSSNYAGDVGQYVLDYGNTFGFGALLTGGSWPLYGVLNSEEAWNMDTKLDDGLPARGKFTVKGHGANVGTASGCTTSANNTDYAGTYRLTNKTADCTLLIRNMF